MSAVCFSSEDGSAADVRCARCEVVTAPPDGGGRLHLRMPVASTLRKARRTLAEAGWDVSEADGIFSVEVAAGQFAGYCAVLRGAFNSVERNTIRAIYLERGRPATLHDYLEADSLERIISRARVAEIADAIEGGRLSAAFQPIVDAESRAIFAHEGLLRVSGSPIAGPDEFFRIARDTDTLPNADLAARQTIIAAAARQKFDGKLFINFMPSSIYDAASCLRSTIRVLDELSVAHDRIVFEVVESDEVVDVKHLLETLDFYRRAGFGVALDDLGSGFASLNLLHALKPDYIKLDLQLVRDVHRDPFKAMLASKLIEAGRALDLGVIAEGVECAEEWDWLREHGAMYVQGYHFARPAATIRSSVSDEEPVTVRL